MTAPLTDAQLDHLDAQTFLRRSIIITDQQLRTLIATVRDQATRLAEVEAVLRKIEGMEHNRCYDCPACLAHKALHGHFPKGSGLCQTCIDATVRAARGES